MQSEDTQWCATMKQQTPGAFQPPISVPIANVPLHWNPMIQSETGKTAVPSSDSELNSPAFSGPLILDSAKMIGTVKQS